MKKLLVGSVALVALIAAAPASAADLRRPAPVYKAPPPPPPPVLTWTGCYIGGHVGGAWADVEWNYTNINPYSAINPAGPIDGTTNTFEPSSWIAGAQAGCQYQFAGGFVIGIEGTWSGTDLNESKPNVVQVFAGSTQTVTTDINSIFTIAGRLGYAFTPNALGYVKGGYAAARIETSGVTAPPVPGLQLDWSTSDWHGGWVAGIGAEFRVMPNITFGVEYNYIGLRTETHVGAVSGGVIGPGNQIVHNVEADIQTVTARVNFLFGPGPGPVVAKY
jgi:outer membrane immunogenic protein